MNEQMSTNCCHTTIQPDGEAAASNSPKISYVHYVSFFDRHIANNTIVNRDSGANTPLIACGSRLY